MFAIAQIKGHQYKLTPGQTVTVDLFDAQEGEEITLPRVLLLADEKSVLVGTPYLEGVSIVAKVVSHKQGKKIRVARFKAKSNYRRVRGFRAQQTELLITKIGKSAYTSTAKKSAK